MQPKSRKLTLPRPLSYPVPSDYLAEAIRRLRPVERAIAGLPGYAGTHAVGCSVLHALEGLLPILAKFDGEVAGHRRVRIRTDREGRE